MFHMNIQEVPIASRELIYWDNKLNPEY